MVRTFMVVTRLSASALLAWCLFAAPLPASAVICHQEPAPVPAADGGLPRRGRIGLTFSESSSGLVIRDVAQNSPAAAAGLRAGDVITSIDGAPARDRTALVERLKAMHVGDELRLAVTRDGEPIEITLALDEPPRKGDQNARVEYNSFSGAAGRMRSVWSFPSKGGSAPRPAVLMIRGVSAPPADAPGNNAFRDLAAYLAERGFIAVRYDGPGIGDSEGGPNSTVDFNAEVADARVALAHVRAHAYVDPSQVVLLGQGTGGGVAAVVAASDPKLAGLIVLGTIARPLFEYVLESRRAQLELAGVTPEMIAEYIQEHIAIFAELIGGTDPTVDPNGIVGAGGVVMGKRAEYWRQYDRVNYAKLYAELTVPVLNAIGEFDFVSTLGEHRAIADALKAKGQKGQVLVVLERTDHDLRQFSTREAAYEGFDSLEAPPNERAFGKILDWIRENARATGD
jgi:alpha-beta hydrolase superfamily lysophospholipase